jgi:hypothetical protein
MSFEGSNECSGIPVTSGDDGKHLRIPNNADNDSIVGLDNIPAECNIHILQFLDVDDIVNVAQVARRFHMHSCHPSLPQNRTATLTCVYRVDERTGRLSASPLPLLQKLISKGDCHRYWRFNKVKIIGHDIFEHVSRPRERGMRLDLGRKLQHVQILDLSFPSHALKNNTNFELCIVALLAFTMPCLREIDLSNAKVAESDLQYLACACPELEKITWIHHHHHRARNFMQGSALNACRCLKEIYMDDSTFYYQYINELMAIQIEGPDSHIFSRCNTFLERVSLRNAKYDFNELNQSFPQYGLLKVVRNTPSLRWFRSDLSPENVAILQAERPEVTFV